MNPFIKLKTKLLSKKQPSQGSANVTTQPSLTQPGPSTRTITKFKDRLRLRRRPVLDPDRTVIVVSTPSPQPHCATESNADTAIVLVNPLDPATQSTPGTPRTTATSKLSPSAVIVTTHPSQIQNQATVELTAWHGINNVLNIACQAPEAFDSLKNVLSGTAAVLKAYDQLTGNKENVANMIDQLISLEHSTTLEQTDDTSESERRDKLHGALQRILTDLGQVSDHKMVEEISNSAQDEQVLTGYINDIRDVLLDYKVSLQRGIHQMLSKQGSGSASSDVNPRTGFFTGAIHADARHGVFTDVAGDVNIGEVNIKEVNIKIEMKDNDLLLLDKLPHVKNAGHLSGNHDTCLKGTRRQELQRIEDWEMDDENKRVYWLNGLAGTGKSTIAQTFAQLSSGKRRLGASFFCSRDFDDRCNIHLIFPTLSYHLAHKYIGFKTALIPIISSSPNVGHESLAMQLENLLIRPLKSTGISTTIIIDALDECKDNQPASAILSLLGQHIDAIPSVKFFITGRPEVPIRSGFRLRLLRPHTEAFLLHDVDWASVDQDIEFYLRTRLSEIITERSDCDVTIPWPTDEEIAAMVKKCSGLFLVGSITVKFIGSRHRIPQERLEIIIGNPDSTVHEGKSGIDVTYHQILLQSFDDEDITDPEFFARLRLVVGSIVLAFNPLSCANLVQILDVPRTRVRGAIRSLHSVLVVPDSDSRPLRIGHKSFADFLTDTNRCIDTRFYIDSAVHHSKLGMCCLKLMNQLLKKNICGLPPYAMNDAIDDLSERREKFIGGGLEYACVSWARHLRFASRGGDDVGCIVELLDYFFKHHLLPWLEVLSIAGDLRRAVYSLQNVKIWLVDVGSPDTDLIAIVKDGERFVLRFFDSIEASAMHIYHSGLPWSPASSLVRVLYRTQIPRDVKLLNAIDFSWGTCIKTIQAQGMVRRITLSHRDDLIAVGEDDCVNVFEVPTGQRRATLTGNKYPRSLAFSPDDLLLVGGFEGGIVNVWDLQTGGLVSVLEGHTKNINSVIFSPCGTMIASCSDDYTIRIWNVSSYDCRCVLEDHPDRVWTICWLTGGREIISRLFDGTIKVWDISEMKCSKTFTGHTSMVSSIACSPDSLFIASESSDRTVKILDAHTGDTCDFRTIPRNGFVTSIRFLDKDRVMYTVSLKHKTTSTFVIWDLTNNADDLVFEYEGDITAFSSDGTCIVSSSGSIVKVWHTGNTRENYRVVVPSHHSDKVQAVAFSDDGKLIASGSNDATVKLWDATTGLCLETFHGHFSAIGVIVFSPDSTLCASGSYFDTIRIWNVHTRTLVSTFKTKSTCSLSVGFSPNSNQMVSLQKSILEDQPLQLTLWEVATGECLALMDMDDTFKGVAFGVDGTRVILTSDDASVKGWEISTAPQVPSDHQSSVQVDTLPMAFVPVHDIQQSAPPDTILRHYHYRNESEWILDGHNRRVLWIPADMRGFSSNWHGNKVVLGSHTGRVPILDFPDPR